LISPSDRNSLAVSKWSPLPNSLGATGTCKTFSVAAVIEKVGKTHAGAGSQQNLAAQLCNELREFFTGNAVEYFCELLRLLST